MYTSTVCLFVAMITVAIKEVTKAINLSMTCTETYVFEAFSDGSLSIFLCVVSIERSKTRGLGKTGEEGERKGGKWKLQLWRRRDGSSFLFIGKEKSLSVVHDIMQSKTINLIKLIQTSVQDNKANGAVLDLFGFNGDHWITKYNIDVLWIHYTFDF